MKIPIQKLIFTIFLYGAELDNQRTRKAELLGLRFGAGEDYKIIHGQPRA